MAENKRPPFDAPEGESEIIAGYHLEYSGMRFGLFYMAEFLEVPVIGALVATLFLGGWAVPWLSQADDHRRRHGRLRRSGSPRASACSSTSSPSC